VDSAGARGTEEQLGASVVDGRRCEVWGRSEADDGGTWHNATVFRRHARSDRKDALTTGVAWRLPPGLALQRARELSEQEQVALFQRALRPRQPLP